MWNADICIYHSPCDDGFGAAWAARRRWPDIVMLPTNYGLPLSNDSLAGKHVLIADFSYKPDMLAMIAGRAASVIILDHHKTAEQDLRDFNVETCGDAKFTAADADGLIRDLVDLGRPPIAAHFDMNRSGAIITWEFCFPDEPVPQLLLHIQDRDLWRNELDNTQRISLLLRSYPYEFELWDRLVEDFDDLTGRRQWDLLQQADGIQRFFDRKIAELLPTATTKSFGKWKNVPVAYAPYAFTSDLAAALLAANPDAPFVAIIVDAYGERTYSLRSQDHREDVSAIARQYGGGGHRNAAGFRVPA